MGLFDFLMGPDINAGVEAYKQTPGAVLLDVRDPSEYRSGHIPGSINIPVSNIQAAQSKIQDRNTPIFTYCLSGGRSSSAASALKQMGYVNVQNIGGIGRYKGPKER